MINILKRIYNIRIDFYYPGNKNILIYDNSNFEVFKKYIKKYTYKIFYTRFEEINFLILLISFYFFCKNLLFLNFKPIKDYYIEEYIKAVKPKIIISFIDNRDSYFYLKKKFPSIIFLLFQNGNSLVNFNLILKSKKKKATRYVDYFFVFNNFFANEYKKYIFGNKILLGSIKNNSVKITKKKNIDLLFISQFRKKPLNNKNYFMTQKKNFLSWEEIYLTDSNVIKLLGTYCKKKNIKLSIAGFYNKYENYEETQFFKNILNKIHKLKWKIYSRNRIFDSYKLVDQAKIVIFIDSTLGYETVMRKSKCFSISARNHSDKRSLFGWPKKLPLDGPFWTNSTEESKIFTKIDKILDLSEKEWEVIKKKYINDLIIYNFGNFPFKKILKKILSKQNV